METPLAIKTKNDKNLYFQPLDIFHTVHNELLYLTYNMTETMLNFRSALMVAFFNTVSLLLSVYYSIRQSSVVDAMITEYKITLCNQRFGGLDLKPSWACHKGVLL